MTEEKKKLETREVELKDDAPPEPLAKGIYTLELIDIRMADFPDREDPSKINTKLIWIFEEIGTKKIVQKFTGTSRNPVPANKFLPWLKDMNGGTALAAPILAKGATLKAEINSWKGRQFQVMLSITDNGKYNDIQSIMPVAPKQGVDFSGYQDSGAK